MPSHRRIAAIRRFEHRRWAKWQDLPERLPRLRQKINELVGHWPDVATPPINGTSRIVRRGIKHRGQARHMAQHPRRANQEWLVGDGWRNDGLRSRCCHRELLNPNLRLARFAESFRNAASHREFRRPSLRILPNRSRRTLRVSSSSYPDETQYPRRVSQSSKQETRLRSFNS